MNKYKSGKCTICEQDFSLLHWHHTVPQALGGVNSLQIPLCSDCHNVLHAHASAIVARMNSGKKITRQYWRTPRMAENAQQWVAILVDAILNPTISAEDKGYKLQLEVPGKLHRALQVLKQDLPGVTSLPDTIMYCIAETLKHKGLTDGNATNNRSQSRRQPKRSKDDLW